MSQTLETIAREASRRGETEASALRHLVLTEIVHKIARSEDRERFVLRGGLLTRAWVQPRSRPTRDLDFVGDYPFDVEDTNQRLSRALTSEERGPLALSVARVRAHGIWLDTEFPGVRLEVELSLEGVTSLEPVSIDVGFRDPLVPEPTWIMLDSEGGARVRAVRPETQVAWKLHALAEMQESFRPKDLADLYRIITSKSVTLVAADLAPAIRAAFESRGYSIDDARTVLHRSHWKTKTSRVRWSPDRTGRGLPPLEAVLEEVRAALALDSLISPEAQSQTSTQRR